MSDLIKIKATASTYKHKTNQKTTWDDFHLVYNKDCNSLDGYGTSIVGRRRFPFIIIGELLHFSRDGKREIRLTKHHPTLQTYPCIEYKGVISGSTIDIISNHSYGSIRMCV